MRKFGSDCWELDALEPKFIAALIRKETLKLRDDKKWDALIDQEKSHRELLTKAADGWDDIAKGLESEE